MAGLRLMGDDPDEVRRVADVLMRLAKAEPGLIVTRPREIPNRRGPGCRVYAEIEVADDPADEPTRMRATAERIVPPRRALGSGRRAVEPG